MRGAEERIAWLANLRQALRDALNTAPANFAKDREEYQRLMIDLADLLERCSIELDERAFYYAWLQEIIELNKTGVNVVVFPFDRVRRMILLGELGKKFVELQNDDAPQDAT